VAACEQSYTGAALRDVLPGFHRKKRSNALPKRRKKADPFAAERTIRIVGAGQHNLQQVSLEVPREQLSVFCGPSGSGKTSLAMDTLYAEGQRRYVESLSAYARQFLGQMPKPKVESIHGLSPAIAIEQKTVGATPRSTVGTVTEIYDYLRVLFARLGTIYCPECGVPAEQQTTDQIVERILQQPAGTRLLITAPVEIDRTIPFSRLWERLQSSGFARVRVDGVTHSLEAAPEIDHRRQHSVAVVVDRISVDPAQRGRLTDSVEAALTAGRGVIQVVLADQTTPEQNWKSLRFSLNLSCSSCERSFELQTPQKFSFNSPLGWCRSCEGLGREFGANQDRLITGPERSLRDGAVGSWPDPATNPVFAAMLEALSETFSLPLDEPWYCTATTKNGCRSPPGSCRQPDQRHHSAFFIEVCTPPSKRLPVCLMPIGIHFQKWPANVTVQPAAAHDWKRLPLPSSFAVPRCRSSAACHWRNHSPSSTI
jgi:excinuclease ABC subunit A